MAQIVCCPSCKKSVQVPDSLVGKQVRCTQCKQVFAIPAGRPAVAAGPVRSGPPPLAGGGPPSAAVAGRPFPAAAPAAAGRCPSCQAALLPGAVSCVECGCLVKPTSPAAAPPRAAVAVKPGPLPSRAPAAAPVQPTVRAEPEAVAAAVPVGGSRMWSTRMKLLPAGVLSVVLGGLVIRDLCVKPPEPPGPEPVVESPLDSEPRLAANFQPGTMQFGLTLPQERDATGRQKRLTYSETGETNYFHLRIDGQLLPFGRWYWFRGDAHKENGTLKASGGAAEPTPGEWKDADISLGQDDKGRTRIGKKSVWYFEKQQLLVTQSVEIVPGQQAVAPGQKRQLNTCLVRFLIESKDSQPHRLGVRFLLDTFIGTNDGVPFTIPGSSALCDTQHDFGSPAEVPDFIQALEFPSLDKPGTVAHLTLKPGGKLEPPSRVSLCHFDWHKVFGWDVPVEPINGDSAVVIYWEDKELPANGRREMGFAYGLGSVAGAEGGGKLAVTVGGSFKPGEDFTVTAYVNNPIAGQSVRLQLDKGLDLVQGGETQAVPPLPPGAKSQNSPVTWKVKADRVGRYNLKVYSSSGASQAQGVVIKSNGIFD